MQKKCGKKSSREIKQTAWQEFFQLPAIHLLLMVANITLKKGNSCCHGINTTTHQLLGQKFLQQSMRSEEHTSELQSRFDLVCRLLLEKKKCDRKQSRASCRRKPTS